MEKIIYGVNFILMLAIARYEFYSDSDKTIIISSLAFLILVVSNLMLGLFAQFDKKPVYRHFYYSALALVVSCVVLLSVW